MSASSSEWENLKCGTGSTPVTRVRGWRGRDVTAGEGSRRLSAVSKAIGANDDGRVIRYARQSMVVLIY